MKLLKQLLFTAVVVIGFSLTASAQDRDGKKEKPPKERGEIQPVEKKNPKNNENNNNNNDNNNNKGKKPQTFSLIGENKIEITSI